MADNWIGCDFCNKWRLIPADATALNDKSTKHSGDEDWHCELGVGIAAKGFNDYITRANWLCTDPEGSDLRIYQVDEKWQAMVNNGVAPPPEPEPLPVPSPAPAPVAKQTARTSGGFTASFPPPQTLPTTNVDPDPLGIESGAAAEEMVGIIKSSPAPKLAPKSGLGDQGCAAGVVLDVSGIGGRFCRGEGKDTTGITDGIRQREINMQEYEHLEYTGMEFGVTSSYPDLSGSCIGGSGGKVAVFVGEVEGMRGAGGLGMEDIVRGVGEEREVKVLEGGGKAVSMKISSFHHSLISKSGTPAAYNPNALNLISLELSSSNPNLSELVKVPKYVEEMDVIGKAWTGETKVRNYVIASQPNSYVDFSVDSSGLCTWYNVVKGRLVFYVVDEDGDEGGVRGRGQYESWRKEGGKGWLGERVKVKKLTVNAGSTVFLPSGTVYGWYAPEDTMAFAGSWIEIRGIGRMVEVKEMEDRIGANEGERLKGWTQLQFYICAYLIKRFRGHLMPPLSETDCVGMDQWLRCLEGLVGRKEKGKGSAGKGNENEKDVARSAGYADIAAMLKEIKQLFAATGWSKILPLPTDAPTAPQASKTWNVETSTPATSTSIGSVPQPAQAPPPAFGGPPPPAFGAPPPAFGIPPPNPKPSLSIRMKVQHTAGAELDKDDEDFELDEGDEEDVEESYEAFQALKDRKRKGEDEFEDDLEDFADEYEEYDDDLVEDDTELAQKKKKRKKGPTGGGGGGGGNKLSISISKKSIMQAQKETKSKHDTGRDALFKKLNNWK